MKRSEQIHQIQELFAENLPACASAVPQMEEELRKSSYPPSFIYKLSQTIFKVRETLMKKRLSNPLEYFYSVYNMEMGSLNAK